MKEKMDAKTVAKKVPATRVLILATTIDIQDSYFQTVL